MKIYLINLDRSRERLVRMTERFRSLNLGIARVPAVDGRALPRDQIEQFLLKRRSRRWNYGEIGCFLSHMNCWKALINSDEPYCAIFEDDAFLSSELTALLSGDRWIPADADIVRLETTFWKTEITTEYEVISEKLKLHRLLSLHHGAGAYIISRKAARNLLANPERLRTTLDSALFDFQEKSCRDLRIYQLDPAPALQESVYMSLVVAKSDSYSEITQTDWAPTSELPLRLRKLVREINRPLRKLGSWSAQSIRIHQNYSTTRRIKFYGIIDDAPENYYAPGD